MNDYDESTAFLGHWGPFQKIVFFLLSASTIPNGAGVLSIIYVADIPVHHCMIPEVNLSQAWLDVIIPSEVVNGKQELSSCSRYRLDVVRNLSDNGLIPGRDVNVTDLEQEGCVDGWSYSKDIYQSTIVSEFDLVCTEQWKQPFTSTLYFLGVLFGSFFSGQLSDRCGRKPVFFTTMALQTIFTFAQVFSPTWTVFSILFFLSGLGQIGNYMAAFVLGAEILTGKVRVLYSSLGVCLCFAIGYMVLPLFAYFLRDWQSLLLAVALCGLPYIPLWWFIPESPRWLVSQGRIAEAEAIIRIAAKRNKVEVPENIFQNCKAHEEKRRSKKEERHTVFDLMRTSSIRNTTLILLLLWFTLTLGYLGLSLNSVKLSANPYVSAFISAVVEVPAYISCWLALEYLPRRYTSSCTMILGGVSLFFIQLVPQNLPWLSVTLEMLGKFGFTTGTSLVQVYTTEIYPTVLRSTATGLCATFSRISGCIAPIIFYLSVYFQYLPYVILGSLAVVSALCAFFLPETLGQPLYETVEQMKKGKRFALLMGYYGLSLNSAKLGTNPYVSAFISAVVEVPAYISAWLALQYLPRRFSSSSTMFLGGVSLFFIQLVPENLPAMSIALEMLGKFGFTTAASLVYAYSAEIYPTVLRSTAMGCCATISRVGSCIAPAVFQLRVYFKYLPYIILGSLAVASAVGTLFLPETFGKPLLETIEQMNKRKRLKCPCITQEETEEPVVPLESQL